MIKVGVTGADTPEGGELLRLLVLHPEVEIVSAYAPALAAHPVSSRHFGFMGCERIAFTSHFDSSSLDVAMLLAPVYSASDWAKLMSDNPSLKVIMTSSSDSLAEGFNSVPALGLSEVNRKTLVRGCRAAAVPDAVVSIVLTALYPLAMHLMLPKDINIRMSLPEDMMEALTNKEASLAGRWAEEILHRLQISQSSLTDLPSLEFTSSEGNRHMGMVLDLPSASPVEEVRRIYESVYDDHNFTFMTSGIPDPREVTATQKVVIGLEQQDDSTLRVRAVADSRMRGAAGDIVHVMNLLCGLYEKTGLDLKSSSFE